MLKEIEGLNAGGRMFVTLVEAWEAKHYPFDLRIRSPQ